MFINTIDTTMKKIQSIIAIEIEHRTTIIEDIKIKMTVTSIKPKTHPITKNPFLILNLNQTNNLPTKMLHLIPITSGRMTCTNPTMRNGHVTWTSTSKLTANMITITQIGMTTLSMIMIPVRVSMV